MEPLLTARITAAAAVTAVLWAWTVAKYPDLLQPDLTITDAAANRTVLDAVLLSLAAGAVILLPSLTWLYRLFQRGPERAGAGQAGSARTDRTDQPD
jgi:cytochrome d ubiquinol oxidase subunit II